MKKFLTLVTVASLITTPAFARDHHRREHKEHHHSGILPFVGGVVVGALIGSSRRDDDRYEERRDYRYDPYYNAPDRIERYYHRPQVYYGNPTIICQDVRIVDHYTGEAYTRKVCDER